MLLTQCANYLCEELDRRTNVVSEHRDMMKERLGISQVNCNLCQTENVKLTFKTT